ILVQMGAGVGIMAEMRGDVHYYWNFAAPAAAIMQGSPIKIIAIFNRLFHQVVARSELKAAPDFRGKKFGVSRIEGADHLQAKLILKAKGIDPKDLQFINLGGGDSARALALKQGLVEAIAVSPPNPFALQKEGYRVVGTPRDLKVGLLASALSIANQRLKEKPDEVKKVLKAIIRGLRFMHERRDETISLMSQWLGQSHEVAASSYAVILPDLSPDGTFPDAEIQFSLEEIEGAMRLPKSTPVSQVRDFTMLYEVQKELGLRR
ncbi:MAG: ABC transporter substrate-binding protein, partial [Chromatiales bacterium]